jgi:hypothetical protein
VTARTVEGMAPYPGQARWPDRARWPMIVTADGCRRRSFGVPGTPVTGQDVTEPSGRDRIAPQCPAGIEVGGQAPRKSRAARTTSASLAR